MKINNYKSFLYLLNLKKLKINKSKDLTILILVNQCKIDKYE
jgi:hypothetical protein